MDSTVFIKKKKRMSQYEDAPYFPTSQFQIGITFVRLFKIKIKFHHIFAFKIIQTCIF